MIFEWDETKNDSNERKHGLRFELAIVVFDDPMSLTEQDREVDGETRWRTLGRVGARYILFVAHTYDDAETHEEVIRIISARQATPQERREYDSQT